MPTFTTRRGQHLSAQRGLKLLNAHTPRPAGAVTRKDFTDRLGLPADASDGEILSAVDAAKPTRAAVSAEDKLYAAAFTATAHAHGSTSPTDEALYSAAFGEVGR